LLPIRRSARGGSCSARSRSPCSRSKARAPIVEPSRCCRAGRGADAVREPRAASLAGYSAAT
jgi:hypothetical protein